MIDVIILGFALVVVMFPFYVSIFSLSKRYVTTNILLNTACNILFATVAFVVYGKISIVMLVILMFMIIYYSFSWMWNVKAIFSELTLYEEKLSLLKEIKYYQTSLKVIFIASTLVYVGFLVLFSLSDFIVHISYVELLYVVFTTALSYVQVLVHLRKELF